MHRAPGRTTARRAALLALFALPVVAQAGSAAAAPDADWNVTPYPPTEGQSALYSVANPLVTSAIWSFDASAPPPTGPSVTHTYATSGTKQFTLTLVPPSLLSSTKTVEVNGKPSAAFGFGPTSVLPNEPIQFANDSTDDGNSLTYAWSFGDGQNSTARNPTHSYATPGSKTVSLVATDQYGASSAPVTGTVVVRTPVSPPAPPTAPVPANAPPSAAFAFSPHTPTAGQQAEFVSSALDPEGRLREQRWDLDGDGEFDDARGDEVLYTFPSPGPKTVRLRVEDAAGAAAVRERTLTVAAGPVARAGFLSPFPVVRLTGEVRGRGAKVRLLSVRAPRGSQVRVSCDGRGCPVKNKLRSVGKGPLRFKIFERMLRAGTKLEVFVRKLGAIGKYTSFAIRAGDSPKRTDRCLSPGVKRPQRCGTS